MLPLHPHIILAATDANLFGILIAGLFVTALAAKIGAAIFRIFFGLIKLGIGLVVLSIIFGIVALFVAIGR